MSGKKEKKSENHIEHKTESSKKLHEEKKKTLGSGDLRQAVQLPDGESLNEWLAVNTIDFFNLVNILYESISEFCTSKSCPKMVSKNDYEYLWFEEGMDDPVSVSAPKYVLKLMRWIEKKITDSNVFPDGSKSFPKNFKSEIKQIFKRLFRVFAHIYHAHIDHIKELDNEAHVNTAFKHFYYFIFEFKLIQNLRELNPLRDEVIDIVGKEFDIKHLKKKKKKKKK